MTTSPPCTLIPLGQEHIEDIGLIDRICFADTWLKRSFIEELGAHCALNRVAVDLSDNVSVLGFCLGRVAVDEYTIHRLAVHPASQRRGIAGHMLHLCMEMAARKGAVSCFVEVRAGNTVAQRLYLRTGFDCIGERKAYYQPEAEDALLMRCDLATAHCCTPHLPE